VHLGCHQDALAAYEAARVTIEELEAETPPAAGSPDPIVVAPEPSTQVVVAPAAEGDAEEKIVWIDISLIEPHPQNPRIEYPEEKYAALVANMKRDGRADPCHPLVVRRVGARYEALSGNTRLKAGNEARLGQMPVIIVAATDKEALVYLARANVQEPFTALEHGLHSLQLDEAGVAMKDYAVGCGLKPPNLSRYRKGARVFLVVKPTLADDNVIILRERAEHLAAIEKAHPAHWADLVDRCILEGWSIVETKQQVEYVEAMAEPTDDAEVPATEPADETNGNASPGNLAVLEPEQDEDEDEDEDEEDADVPAGDADPDVGDHDAEDEEDDGQGESEDEEPAAAAGDEAPLDTQAIGTSNNTCTRDALILEIARINFEIETLDARGSEELDFPEVYVDDLRAALVAAYEAGRASVA
jgi:ParB-like chromosome segregation protein Spo0J